MSCRLRLVRQWYNVCFVIKLPEVIISRLMDSLAVDWVLEIRSWQKRHRVFLSSSLYSASLLSQIIPQNEFQE